MARFQLLSSMIDRHRQQRLLFGCFFLLAAAPQQTWGFVSPTVTTTRSSSSSSSAMGYQSTTAMPEMPSLLPEQTLAEQYQKLGVSRHSPPPNPRPEQRMTQHQYHQERHHGKDEDRDRMDSHSSNRPIQPVFVMDKTSAIASSLALYTMQALIEDITIPREKNQQPPQLPVFLIDYPEQLSDAMRTSPRQPNQSDSILHVPIDVTTGKLTISPEILQQASFVGLYLHGDKVGVDDDIAKSAGSALTQVFDVLSKSRNHNDERTEFVSTVSLDLNLFLSMLKLNSLPKNPNAPHGDSYHIAMPEGGSLVMKYHFDHDNRMGGSDPLLCPNTEETLVETPPTQPSLLRSQHLNAAYTSLYGQGLSAEASAAIAASVATILGDDNGSANSISWDMIGRTVQLSDFIRRMGTSEQDSGFIRKKYKEFGYN